MSLKSLQQRMAAAVMAPLTRRDTMARIRPDGVRMEAEAAAFIKPNDRLSSFERLEIYNRQYWLRVLAALAEDFPGLRAVLGRTRFDGLSRAYLTDCPSRSFTMRNLGSRLPQWLEAHPQWIDPRGALALDMARLEWAHIEAFDEASLPVAGAADLEGLDEVTRLTLQPYLRLLRLTHPVDRLRVGLPADRHQAVRRIPPVPPEPVHLVVHRLEQSVYYKRVEPEAFGILQALRDGAALGAAIEAGFKASAMPEIERPGFLARSFHDWAGFGWFTSGVADA